MIHPNKFRVENNICYLELNNIKKEVVAEAILDYEDYEKIKQYRFIRMLNNKGRYIGVRSNTGQLLHHLIIGTPPEKLETDHINRNPLDNRKSNLRFVTSSQNGMNRSKYDKTTSIYKGVRWDKERNKWKVAIKLNNKTMYVGRFNDEMEAAKAYDTEALKLFGRKFAVLNIKEEI